MGDESPRPASTPTEAVFLSYASGRMPRRNKRIVMHCVQPALRSGSTSASCAAERPGLQECFETNGRVGKPLGT